MKKHVWDFAATAAGAFLLALAIQVFLVPAQLSTGGVSGVATVLYYLARIPLFLTTLLINLILFFFGFRTFSPSDIPKNLMGILLLSLFLKVLQPVPAYEGDLLMAALFGGVVAGIGVGLAMLRGASTGGTDFAALMLHRRFSHISPSAFIMGMDTVIIVLSGLIYRNLTVMFYSILSLYVSNRVVDVIMVRGSAVKSVMVISPRCDAIASRIMKELRRGVTGMRIHGYYSKREGKGLFCVVRPRQVPALLNLIKAEDSAAFTVISDVRQVRGEGFDRETGEKKKKEKA